MGQFFGKYRGKVVGNSDPFHMGQILVTVPKVSGAGHQAWAMLCVPYAGAGVGGFAIPPVKANVWIEFEEATPIIQSGVSKSYSDSATPTLNSTSASV